MEEFKIGDRVSYDRYHHRGTGTIVAISKIAEDTPYWIEVDNDSDGYKYNTISNIIAEDKVELCEDARYQWANLSDMTLLSLGVNYKLIKTEFLQGVEL